MTTSFTIALAQLNPRLGDVAGNCDRLAKARGEAAKNGALVIVTPEMYLSGYPCDDLVLRDDFMGEIVAGVDRLAAMTKDGGPAIIVGAPMLKTGVFLTLSLCSMMARLLPVATKSICQIMVYLMINAILPLAVCQGR